MKTFVLTALALFGCVLGLNLDRLFRRYAGADHVMSMEEFGKYWMHFDQNGDGNVTKSEFDTTWKNEDLGDEDRAPFFFLELDRVADEVLNKDDVPHIFRLFDENADGSVANDEFRFNWKGLFDD